MSSVDYCSFVKMFNDVSESNNLDIRYTIDRAGDVIHQVIRIFRQNDQFFIQEIEINQSKNTKEIILEKDLITEISFKSKHAYLATLFFTLKPATTTKTRAWEGFKLAESKIKWLIRYFILDTQLVGGVVGKIIAYSANKENPHYTTAASHILAKTLGPLIFPAGSKKPKLLKKGTVLIDSILHMQYKALKNYNGVYTSKIDPEKTIEFIPKNVQMTLNDRSINLETVVASNECVNKCEEDHLHIVYFNGNCGCFQDDYKIIAEDLIEFTKKNIPVSAVQFNYPGILNSEGKVEYSQELIDAGVAQVEKLIDEGVSPKNIVLHGVSLGGSISSHVAVHFYKKKIVLGGLYVSRTFASTAQVGRDFFNRALGDNIISRFISTIFLPVIKFGTWVSGWDLDTGNAFFSFPKNKRNYSVVISPKKNTVEYLQKQKRSIRQRFFDFVLMRRRAPADDAILRRGLHDSWEKKWEAFLTMCGWYGIQARKSYSKENQYRKMVVVDFEKYELAPEIDGHAKADYSYLLSGQNIRRINPKKEKVFGLVHHSLLTGSCQKNGNLKHLLKLKMQEVMHHEAGFVFRNWVLEITGRGEQGLY
jgi:Chlamydia CHLPS protein (DUF818)